MASSPRSAPARRSPTLALPKATEVGWTETDIRAVDTVRLLAADAVQKVGNGHPGTAISLAPLAYLLYQNVMRHDPSDLTWLGRDRFVLSCGHSSLTQYIQLYLGGFGLELADLQALRTWDSKTPGHPEVHHTAGVEITTGPLGSGLASAVGMAMAQRRQRGLLDPDAPAGKSPFDHHIWVIASDGDIMEGVASEACSLAGHQELGNLTVIYDQNQISIEDDTDIAFSEDVAGRYEAYGWNTVTVDWRGDGDGGSYVEDVDALYAALTRSRPATKPTLVILRTIITWPAPNAQDTGASHGSALGAEEVALLKELLGFDQKKTFQVDKAVLTHTRGLKKRAKADRKDWDIAYRAWRRSNRAGAELLDRLVRGSLPAELTTTLPTFPADEKGLATRAASGQVLGALAPIMPELWGGSADLAGSNNTTMAGEPSFVPPGKQTEEFSGGWYGRTLHFGVRENAMGMILNGISLEGLTRPYGGTFLVFSDYMRPAVRLACIQQLPVTFVWTHDSIGLGEDGPTHQPIEHLAALRAMPGLAVVRPADANETSVVWGEILRRAEPAGLCLSRQAVPTLDRSRYASASNAAKGAYILAEASGDSPEVILIATGSEVSIALEARERLEKSKVPTRVVSMPCREWFAAQSAAYRKKVLPDDVRARVSVEAASQLGWRDFVGDAGETVAIDQFGASADAGTLFEKFGFTPAAVVKAARASLKRAGADAAARTSTKSPAKKSTATKATAKKSTATKSTARTDTRPRGRAAKKAAVSEGN